MNDSDTWHQAAAAPALTGPVAAAIAQRAATDPTLNATLACRTHPFPVAGLDQLLADPATIDTWVAQPNVTVDMLLGQLGRIGQLPARRLVALIQTVDVLIAGQRAARPADRQSTPARLIDGRQTGWTTAAVQPFVDWLSGRRNTPASALVAAAPLVQMGCETSVRWLIATLRSGSTAVSSSSARTGRSTTTQLHRRIIEVASSATCPTELRLELLQAIADRPDSPATGRLDLIVQELPVDVQLPATLTVPLLNAVIGADASLQRPRLIASHLVLRTVPEQRAALTDQVRILRPAMPLPGRSNRPEDLVWACPPDRLADLDGLPSRDTMRRLPFAQMQERQADAAARRLAAIADAVDDLHAGWAIWEALPDSLPDADRLAAVAAVHR